LRIEEEGFEHVLLRHVAIATYSSGTQMAVLMEQNLEYGLSKLHRNVKMSVLFRRKDVGK
jgi:hypothetical protein